MKTTGLRRRSESTRRRFSAERSYGLALLPLQTVFQLVAFTHDQKGKPSCVGQAWTGRLEAHLKRRLSAVDLWSDARRRQGDMGNPLVGTDSEHAVESLLNRGVSPYVEGEDDRDPDEDMKLPELAQELAADDHRLDAAAARNHRVIDAPRRAAVVDALTQGKAVCTGGGVRPGYSGVRVNQVVTEQYLGGEDGHEQGICGYISPDDVRFPEEWRDCFIFVNSWGDWAGIILPCDVTCVDGTVLRAGTLLESCALVPARLLDEQWDCDTLDVVIS